MTFMFGKAIQIHGFARDIKKNIRLVQKAYNFLQNAADKPAKGGGKNKKMEQENIKNTTQKLYERNRNFIHILAVTLS